ncbi:MAG: FtsW/RodA/SpoVE family cell cycle protein [Bacteroidales bacterium]|jgi:cell division protein FtsW|nr:FtsW/RodA/SpoVE family cell cycle protein [Bacteroidales bacterium]
MGLIGNLFKGDKVVWIVFAFLSLISLVEVYSASSTLAYSGSSTFGPILRHGLFLLLGAGLMLVLHNLKLKWITFMGLGLTLVAFLLLVLTPVIGVRVNNAARWISIFGIQFQPSEFAKLAMVIVTAFILSKTQRSEAMLDKAFWIILALTGVFAALIVPENGSTAVMLCLVVFFMMVVGRIRTKKLLFLGGSVLLVVFLAVFLLKVVDEVPGMPRWDTWQNRLFGEEISVTDPDFRITDKNYQTSHAKIAVANGTIVGSMPGNSTQRDFLPQAYSDFIYAIIIEEMGWIGLLLVPFLYIVLLLRALHIAKNCTKIYPMLLIMGAALMVCTQAFINMSVAVGALPVTGQPMPLVSRGGTSTLITALYFGIMLSVSRFGNPEWVEKEAAENDEDHELDQQALTTASEYGV